MRDDVERSKTVFVLSEKKDEFDFLFHWKLFFLNSRLEFNSQLRNDWNRNFWCKNGFYSMQKEEEEKK